MITVSKHMCYDSNIFIVVIVEVIVVVMVVVMVVVIIIVDFNTQVLLQIWMKNSVKYLEL